MMSLVKIHRPRLIPIQVGPGGGHPPARASRWRPVPCPCPNFKLCLEEKVMFQIRNLVRLSQETMSRLLLMSSLPMSPISIADVGV